MIEGKELDIQDKNIIDVDLSITAKKKFRLDRDNNRVIELNTSDLRIINRLEEVYPKMLKFVNEANKKIASKPDDDTSSVYGEALAHIDKEMRDLVNYVFDSDVADKAAPNGSMYDPYNGQFMFEIIFDRLFALYEQNLKIELDAMKKRMQKHTSKYTKGKK